MKRSIGVLRAKKVRRAKVYPISENYTLSRAQTYLGRLLEQAQNGQTVYILRGRNRFILQAVPEIEPIPLRPAGYFTGCYSKQDARLENRLARASVVGAPKELE